MKTKEQLNELQMLCQKLADHLSANYLAEIKTPNSISPTQSLYFELRKTIYQLKNAPGAFGLPNA